MSVCFGVLKLNGTAVGSSALARMNQGLSDWGAAGERFYTDGAIALGYRPAKITAEDQHDHQPRQSLQIVLIAHLRLDNRAELCRQFGMEDVITLPDSQLIVMSYQRYGTDCVQHLRGDWVFALWDAACQRLLIARDASGNTGLYWWLSGDGCLVFSTGMKGILAYPNFHRRKDLAFAAGILTVFIDPAHATNASYEQVQRLLPGHYLLADTSGQTPRLHRWWQPENLPTLTFKKPDDYYSAFLELYSDAVAQRLRVQGQQRIAATLSGGLDSGSVVALAAPLLAKRGEPLTCYVHVPFYAPDAASKRRSGDELELAQQTAMHVGNTCLLPLYSEKTLLLDSMDKFLHTHDAPGHAAGNQYWIADLLEAARSAGSTVLLTGQGGNATVSFNGDGKLWHELLTGHLGKIFTILRNEQGGIWQAVKQRLLKPAVEPYLAYWQQYSKHAFKPTVWERYSAINPAFAEELALLPRMQALGFDPSFSVVNPERRQAFRLGTMQSRAYELWMENGAAYGLDVRDPTRDQRIVEFCWRLPDGVFCSGGKVNSGH